MEFHTATLFGLVSPSDAIAMIVAAPVLVGIWLGLRAL